MSYFNNHSHTEFSNLRLLDCINKPEELIDKAIEVGDKYFCQTSGIGHVRSCEIDFVETIFGSQ